MQPPVRGISIQSHGHQFEAYQLGERVLIRRDGVPLGIGTWNLIKGTIDHCASALVAGDPRATAAVRRAVAEALENRSMLEAMLSGSGSDGAWG